jgi:hypothetical protein
LSSFRSTIQKVPTGAFKEPTPPPPVAPPPARTGGLEALGLLGIRRVLLNSGLPELVGSGVGDLYCSPFGKGLSFKGVGELSVAKTL